MKNNCSFLIILLLYFIPYSYCQITTDSDNVNSLNDENVVEIKKAYCTYDKSNKVSNPVFGFDYWETKKLENGEYVDWNVEFFDDTILNSLHFEFDYPPSKMIIYIGQVESHLIPYQTIDYSESILKESGKKILMSTNEVFIHSNIMIKFIKLRFVNEMENPLSVKFLKFAAKSEKSRGKYVISKLMYSNGKMNSYCLKYDENKKGLLLVECYYCVMYSFKACQFIYKDNDDTGILFYHINLNNGVKNEFYIKSLGSEMSLNMKDEIRNNTVEMLSSFLSDEVDYSSDLLRIVANSTISSDYMIKNVLYDNLDYWSSNFTKDQGCPDANIILVLKDPIVVKTILIDWVKTPFYVRIFLCDANQTNCVLNKGVNEFPDFRTNVYNIYSKAKEIKIEMEFDRKRLNDFNYQCICSISNIKIHKNEIELKEVKKDGEQGVTKGNIGTPEKKKLYSDNFLLTKVEEKDQRLGQLALEESYKDIAKINGLHDLIHNSFTNRDSAFGVMLNNITNLSNDYNTEALQKVKRIEYYEKELDKYKKKKRNDKNIKENNVTGTEINQNHGVLTQRLLQFLDLKLFFNNLDSNRNKIKLIYEKSYRNLSKLQFDLNNFMVQNSSYFAQSFSDTLIKASMESTDKIKQEFSTINIYSQFEQLSESIPFVEEGLHTLKQFTKDQLSQKLKYLEEKFNKILNFKKKEISSFLQNFEIVFQNIKLVKSKYKETTISIGDTLKTVNLVTNFFFDNLFVKFFVQFTRESKNEFNMFIFKFLTKDVFFYLKYNGYYLEVWKKKYEIEERLFSFTNCTSEYDKYDQLENFSKLFYIYIKVLDGKLSVMLKIDYQPIPGEITKYLEELENLSYEEFVRLYDQDSNDFASYFRNSTLIYETSDIDLNLGGNFAIDSPRKNTKIVMAAGYPKQNPPKVTNGLTSLQTKYPYSYFQNIDGLVESAQDKNVLESLGLDKTWKFYDTQFQILNNFYFKYKVDIEKLFGESVNMNKLDSETGTNREEQQNSVYFYMFSTRSISSYFLEVVKVENGFILKLFQINNLTRRKVNIYRRKIDLSVKIAKRVLTVSFVKNKESMVLQIKIKGRLLFKNVFTIRDFNYVKFYFLLNPRNYDSISSIYFSDTDGGSFTKHKEASLIKVSSECNRSQFNDFKCIVKDNSVCKTLFCKGCCTKRLMKENMYKYNLCFEKCKQRFQETESMKIRLY